MSDSSNTFGHIHPKLPSLINPQIKRKSSHNNTLLRFFSDSNSAEKIYEF